MIWAPNRPGWTMRHLIRNTITSLAFLAAPALMAQEGNLSLRVVGEQVTDLQSQVDVLRRSLGNSKLGTQQQIRDGIRAAESRWIDDSNRRVDLAAREALRSALREVESELNAVRNQLKAGGTAVSTNATASAGLATQLKSLQERMDAMEQQSLRASLNASPVGVIAPPVDIGPRIDKAVAASEARLLEALKAKPVQDAGAAEESRKLAADIAQLKGRVDELKEGRSEPNRAAPGVTAAEVEKSVTAATKTMQEAFELRAQGLSTRIDTVAAQKAAPAPVSPDLVDEKFEAHQGEIRARLDLFEKMIGDDRATQAAQMQKLASAAALPAPAPSSTEDLAGVRAALEASLAQSNAKALGLETRVAALESENARLSELEKRVAEMFEWKPLPPTVVSLTEEPRPSVSARTRNRGTYLRYLVVDTAGADAARAEALVASNSPVELVSEGNSVLVEVGPITASDEAIALKRTLDSRIGSDGVVESVQ